MRVAPCYHLIVGDADHASRCGFDRDFPTACRTCTLYEYDWEELDWPRDFATIAAWRQTDAWLGTKK